MCRGPFVRGGGLHAASEAYGCLSVLITVCGASRAYKFMLVTETRSLGFKSALLDAI